MRAPECIANQIVLHPDKRCGTVLARVLVVWGGPHSVPGQGCTHLVRKAALPKLEENPLRPAVVRLVRGVNFAAPIVGESACVQGGATRINPQSEYR